MTASTRIALALLTLWIPIAPSLCLAWCNQPAEEVPPCHARAEAHESDSSETTECCPELASERLHGVVSPEPLDFENSAFSLRALAFTFESSARVRPKARPPDGLASPYARQNAPLLS